MSVAEASANKSGEPRVFDLATTLSKKKVMVPFTELDIETTLMALGAMQNKMRDQNLGTKSIDIVIEKIYRAMGVRL